MVQADASTETPKHFIESNIDKSYEWNEWAMRREAAQGVLQTGSEFLYLRNNLF